MAFVKHRVHAWRKDVFRELARPPFRLKPTNPEFNAGLLLAAIAGFGTDLSVLVELTGLPDSLVRRMLKRLRQQRVLVGQTLRVRWDAYGFEGDLAIMCDMLVAVGLLQRPVDPKRSKALKGRTWTPKERRPRAVVPDGAIFSVKRTKSNPLYQIDEQKVTI